MKYLFKILTIFLLLALAVPFEGYAQNTTIIFRNDSDTTVCGGFEWFDTTLTTSGHYGRIVDAVGDTLYVDSLHLTVYQSIYVEEQLAICANNLPYHYVNGGIDTTFEVGTPRQSTFEYHFTTPYGCDSTVTLTLTVNRVSTPIIRGDSIICEGEIDTLTVVGGVRFQWSTGDTTNQIYVIQSGDYSVTAYNAFNCSATTDFGVTVNDLPNVIITGESSLCEGDSATLTASGASMYVWSNGERDSSITVSGAGAYMVTGLSDYGCSNTASHTVLVNTVSYGDTTVTACESFTWHGITYTETPAVQPVFMMDNGNQYGCDSIITLHLTIQSGVVDSLQVAICANDLPYHYVNGGIDTTFEVGTPPHSTSEYHFTTPYGCDSTVTLTLTVNRVSTPIIRGDSAICEGETDTLTVIGGTRFLWSTGDTTSQIYVTQSGDYSVTAYNAFNCSATTDFSVTVNDLPNVIIIGESSFCEGDSATLTASGASVYVWSNGEGDSSITVSGVGTYMVTGLSDYGCSNTASHTVLVNTVSYGDTTVTACESFTWHGITYTETPAVQPVFTMDNGNQYGCDSIITLHLTVLHPHHTAITRSACDSYQWNDSIYTESGDYTFAHNDVNGCLQVDTLHLTIHHSTTSTRPIFVCESELPYRYVDGLIDTVFEIGTPQFSTYNFLFSTQYGCDSTVILQLTILPIPIIIVGDDSICENATTTITAVVNVPCHYIWSTGDTTQQIIVVPGTYTLTVIYENSDCTYTSSDITVDSIYSTMSKRNIVHKSNVAGTPYMLAYPVSGLLYQWYRDDVALEGETKQYYVPADGLAMDSSCYRVNVSSPNPAVCGFITECWQRPAAAKDKISIIPNPNNGHFTLTVPSSTKEVELYNLSGQMMRHETVSATNPLSVDVSNLPDGIYIVKVIGADGEALTDKIVINR